MKTKNSIKGCSAFVLRAVKRGEPVAKIKAEVIRRWPKFSRPSEAPFLKRRIEIAREKLHAHSNN